LRDFLFAWAAAGVSRRRVVSWADFDGRTKCGLFGAEMGRVVKALHIQAFSEKEVSSLTKKPAQWKKYPLFT
jgi:hypothetical protein